MGKWIKRIVFGFGIFITGLGILLALFVLYLKTDHAQQLIQAKIDSAIPGRVTWKSFRFSLSKGEFELKEVKLKSPSDDELAGFDRLFMVLDWNTLFKKKLTISNIQLDKPRLNLTTDENGSLNIMTAFPAPKAEKQATKQADEKNKIPIDIVLRSFQMKEGRLNFEGKKEHIKVSLKQIELTADADLSAQAGNLTLKIGGGNIKTPKVSTDLHPFTLISKIAKDRIESIKLDAGTPFFNIKSAGNIRDLFSKPVLNIKMDFFAILDELKKSMPIQQTLNGQIAGNLKVTGTIDNPSILLAYDYHGGMVFGNRVDDVHMDLILSDRILNLKEMTIRVGSGRSVLRGEIVLKEAFPEGFSSPKMDLEKTKYDIVLNQEHIDLSELLSEKQSIKGIIRSDISIKGQGISPDRLKAQTEIKVKVENLTLDHSAQTIDVGLDARARFASNKIDLEKLEARTGTIVLHSHGNYDFSTQSIFARLNLDAPDLQKNLRPIGIQDVSGSAWLKGDVKGRLKSPTFSALLMGEKLRFMGYTIGDVRLKTQMDQSGFLYIDQLVLKNQGAVLECKGKVQILNDSNQFVTNFPMDMSVFLKDVEAKNFLKGDSTSGKMNGRIEVKGGLDSFIFNTRLTGEKLKYQTFTIGDIRFQSRMDQSGFLHIDQLILENQGSFVECKGKVRIFEESNRLATNFPMNVSILLKDIEAKDFLEGDSTSGKMNGHIQVKGGVNTLEAEGRVSGKDIALPEAEIGDMAVDFRFNKGVIFVDRASIQNKNSKLELKGSAEILNPKTLKPIHDPSFQLNIGDGAIFLQDFVKGIKGNLSLRARLDGSVKKPKGKIDITGRNFDLDVQTIDNIRLASRLEGEKLWIDSLKIGITPEEEIEGRGWVGLDKTYALNLSSKGLRLKNIDRVREQNLADGKIELKLAGKGSFDNPEINGNIVISDLTINNKPFDDFKIRIALKDQQAHVFGDLNFSMEALMQLRSKTFAASFLFRDTDLSPYFRLANLADFAGVLTGKIKASGNATDVKTITTSVDLAKLDLFFKDKEIIHGEALKIDIKKEMIDFSNFNLKILQKGNLNVRGSVKLEGPLDIKVDGEIPVQAAGLFVEDLPGVEGKVIVSGILKGTQNTPEIRAKIDLDRIGLTVPGLMQKLHDLNGSIEITPESVTVDNLAGMLDTGRFEITGKADLIAFQPTRGSAKLMLNALPVSVPDTLDILLNADINLEGTDQKSTVEGEIVLLEGSYSKDVNLNLLTDLGKKKRAEAAPPSEIKSPFLNNMGFDIAVKKRNPFVVENNIANLEVHPDLRITGKPNNPIISGRATIESGTILYRKKQFEVKKGVIDFLNPYKIEPTLDIESELNIRDWQVFLSISGTPDQLNFKLSSEPHEEDADILSLLLIGKTTKELIAGEGGSSDSTSQILGGLIAATLGKQVKSSTGLDIFELEGAGSDSVKVTMGKRLSKRTTVKYSTESKEGEMIQRAMAEYQFFENILLNGYQDSKGVYGGELQFRLEFR